jgi:F-type H+-transporting ATPase subunit delta
MTKSRVAHRYASAIIEMANEEKSLEAVIEDFATLGGAIRSSHDLQSLLASPVIDERTKERILKEIFAGKLSPLTERFVSLLTLKGRSNELPGAITAFQELLDAQRNVVPATVTTASQLSDDQKRRIESQIAEISGRTVRAEYQIDPDLIGGFSARFQDTMIDASVRHQLERLRESLVEGTLN